MDPKELQDKLKATDWQAVAKGGQWFLLSRMDAQGKARCLLFLANDMKKAGRTLEQAENALRTAWSRVPGQ